MIAAPYRFAIVGIGGFASTYLNQMTRLAGDGYGSHVANVAIPRDHELHPEVIADLREQGVALFPSLDKMLAAMRGAIDVVAIPTGIHLHQTMAVVAMEAGCHVIVEKPAAGSVQDVDEMRAASMRTGRLCAVGFQHLYQPEFARLKEWICEGRFGELHSLRCFGTWPRQPSYYARNKWAGMLAVDDTWVLDSPHNNALSHALNCMLFLASKEPKTAATPIGIEAELYRANAIDSADTVTMRVQTKNDVSVYFGASHAVDREESPVFDIVAKRASLSMTYDGDLTITWKDGRIEQYNRKSNSNLVFQGMVQAINTGSPPACSLDVARAHSCCASASFENGIVDIPQDYIEIGTDGTVVVTGLFRELKKACERKALLSELGIKWARAMPPIDLKNYNFFQGKHLIG